MNKLIKQELEKVTEVSISYDDSTTKIYIPKKVDIKLEVGNCYLIKLSDYVLSPPSNDTISINWNGGSIPKYRHYKVDIISNMNNMFKVAGIGYDISTRSDINEVWEGWIPRNEFEVIEVL